MIERERLRVDMNESHRTLIGHFRHEIGHYYWDLLIKDQDEAASIRVFGDHNHPPWRRPRAVLSARRSSRLAHTVISAYAACIRGGFRRDVCLLSGHGAVLIRHHMGLSRAEYDGSLESIQAFHQAGLTVNELNRHGPTGSSPRVLPRGA